MYVCMYVCMFACWLLAHICWCIEILKVGQLQSMWLSYVCVFVRVRRRVHVFVRSCYMCLHACVCTYVILWWHTKTNIHAQTYVYTDRKLQPSKLHARRQHCDGLCVCIYIYTHTHTPLDIYLGYTYIHTLTQRYIYTDRRLQPSKLRARRGVHITASVCAILDEHRRVQIEESTVYMRMCICICICMYMYVCSHPCDGLCDFGWAQKSATHTWFVNFPSNFRIVCHKYYIYIYIYKYVQYAYIHKQTCMHTQSCACATHVWFVNFPSNFEQLATNCTQSLPFFLEKSKRKQNCCII
jgi:hypothetical protein